MKIVMKSFLALGLLLVGTAFYTMEDIIEKLGLQPLSTQKAILNNLIGTQNHYEVDQGNVYDGTSENDESRSFSIPFARSLTSLSTGDQSGAAKALCQYVKTYVQSQQFLKDYQAARQSATPTSEPEAMDPAMITTLKQSIQQQELELKKLRGNKQIPADMIKKFETAIAEQKRTIASAGDPTPNKTLWLKVYPENPQSLVKARLEEYLQLASSVDFNAATTGVGRSRKFTNPVFEKKGRKWKAIYRAGKEVNTTTTAFVKDWLKEGVVLAK